MTTDTSTEFSQYLIHEKAKSVPANNYQLDQSLRVWFIEFEQQAAAHGISNLNSCAVHLSKYMPLLIQRWIPTLPPTVRSDYELLKESLLARFAMDIEEENRLLLKQLRSYQRDTRLTLTSLVTALNINRLSEVIRQAIDLEVRAKLLDAPELADDNNVATPMEIDYVGKYHSKRHNNKFNKQQQSHYKNNNNLQRNNQQHKFNGNTNNPKQQGTQVPRLYNKQGDPVCGYCFKLHRTIDCNQYQKGRNKHSSERHSIHTTEVINVEQHQVDLEEPIKAVQTNTIVAQSINYVNFQHTNTPLSFIQIDNAKITALWDTGSTITCISSEVAHLLKLKIDTTKSILYTDVNKNVNRSHGQVKLNMFNTTITLQVIDNMARDKIDDKMEKLVDLGIVDKVLFSEWGSNITAVPKPNGDIRPCGNYVKLNAITKTIKYPFIHLHHALQSLGTSTIFSKIDLASGYYAIKIKAEDREKTTLVTPNGTYVFNYMPFGLKNAPAVFQSMMDRVLGPLKNVTAIAYLDDIIIHSKSPSQHILDVEQVLSRLKAANLSINKEKCAFGLKSVEFLGFIVSDKGISANPEKIAPILALSAPTNLKEVERFLGVCGVYQKFISNFQVVAEPLRRLKKKDTPFVWTEEQQNSFETLKKKLAELPTLIQPDFNKPFELHCDAATSSEIGVVLCQRDEKGHVYPLAFSSRSLSKFEQKYSVRELEALSIVWGIKKHRVYLEAGHFTVFTDHSSLQWLLSTNQDKQPRLWRWCLFLQAYDFQVKYIPGPTNFVADLLSRDPLPNIAAITLNPWSDDGWWTTEQVKDSAVAKIIQSLQDGTLTAKSFYLKNKILFKKVKYANKVRHFKVVPDHMVTTVISHYHASQFAGHGGSNKTLKAIQNSRLYFTNMDQRVTEFTRSCLVCQRIKGNKNKQFPLSSTSGDYPFQKVALDYFGPLPTNMWKFMRWHQLTPWNWPKRFTMDLF
ncbi:hypothetical protein G6F38_011651 [Rhizopus arrhizus]|nr:hypothetical protein G6F38_011651 [Rhizopus arrhizus]